MVFNSELGGKGYHYQKSEIRIQYFFVITPTIELNNPNNVEIEGLMFILDYDSEFISLDDVKLNEMVIDTSL